MPPATSIPSGGTVRADRFGDPLPPGALARLGTVRLRHLGEVCSLAFAPDGRVLAVGGKDGTVLLWGVPGAGPRSRPGRLSARELQAIWDDLGIAPAARAQGDVWALAAAPERAVPFLRERLRPARSDGRGEVARLIADLDSERFAVRERATRELAELGPLAVPALRRKLMARNLSVEARWRIEGLLKGPRPDPPPEHLRAVRAVRALEYAGTAAARRVLQELARGAAGAPLTEAAQAAAQRPAPRP